MDKEDSDAFYEPITFWDVVAVFTHLIKDLVLSFTKFFDVMEQVFLHQANVVASRRAFHDDVVRTIETITEGE